MSHARRRARQLALQALYQWQITYQPPREIEAQFISDQDMSKVDVPYFRELLHQIPRYLQELDGALAPVLDRPLDQVDLIERAILRIGVYELRHRPEIPYRAVINEAVELAKRFSGEHGYKYVNSILDKLAYSLRGTALF